ncbi:MAG: CoB--CoM heterodisulfide reductase iron-sulfur subunit B family protein [Deltaproteobacteria bacterium]|nr:CoB--CoM heterodisulfide reductase iron-sulfur subunit B family protein [Deltaproteobacteria bacterium]
MKYALFLGCTIPARSRQYELSARKVAQELGIEFVDVEEFICCGFPVKSSEIKSAMVLGAYNIALAERQGLDLCALCSSCTSALTEVAHHLAHDTKAKEEVNESLAKAGLKYDKGVKVRHFARVIYEEVGLDELKKHITRSLEGFRVATHYGCHYLKPSEIYDGFDQVENPHTLDEMIALTGATVVDYVNKKRCCGGPLLAVEEKIALAIAKEKLDDIKTAAADAINLVCPFCSVMYDSNQKSIETAFNASYNLPVLYLTQILGLAMGLDRKELGLNMNVVKTKDLESLLESRRQKPSQE